eukprot:810085-Amorphochlora_amoeboformis.AAC.1
MSNLTRFRGQGGMVDLGLVWVLWWCHLMVDIWLLGTKGGKGGEEGKAWVEGIRDSTAFFNFVG